jgi:hypothetical protein
MTSFGEHVDDYLRLRRALGFKLEEHSRVLPKFAAHLDAIGGRGRDDRPGARVGGGALPRH